MAARRTNPAIVAITSSTIQMSWTGTLGSDYDVEASTMNDFTGTVFTTATTNTAATKLTEIGLAVDTTYYLRVAGRVFMADRRFTA